MWVKLLYGPLDGGEFKNWAWHDSEAGRLGAERGELILDNNVVYRIRDKNENPAIARYVSGVASAALITRVIEVTP